MSNNLNPYDNNALATDEAAVRAYLVRVFNLMAGGLVVTGAVAYAAAVTGFYRALAGTPLIWVVLFAPLGMTLYLRARLDKLTVGATQGFFWAFAGVVGLMLGCIFLIYTGQSIMQVFFITAGTFGAMAAYGYATKADLSSWGSFLMMGLVGVVIASFVNLFLHSDALSWVYSVIGVVVFTGLTAYDVNRIKAFAVANGPYGEAAEKGAIMGALNLYLDFINLFLSLMRLLGNRR